MEFVIDSYWAGLHILQLTYVNFDVPDHSIVVGNPGRVIPKENAVEGYICNGV